MEMVIVTKIGDYHMKGVEKMDKKQILQQYFSQTNEDKGILLEKLAFCGFSDEYDFENYSMIEKLKDSELFCLMSFLYYQDYFFNDVGHYEKA